MGRPQFQYSAKDANSRTITGVIDAPDRAEAIATLASRGTFVTEIHAADSDDASGAGELTFQGLRFWRKGIPAKARAAMLRQVAVALESGLPLLTALRVVKEQADSAAIATLAGELADAVQTGQSLSEAMHDQSDHFSELETSMVRVGESAGVLDTVMTSLADFADRDVEVRQKLASASMYPLIVLALGVVSIVIILTFILPKILEPVRDTIDVLPWPTRMLMGISDLLTSPAGWFLLVVVVAAVASLMQWIGTPSGRLALDRFKLWLPVLGPAVRRVAVARFARSLGTLTQAGVPIVEAMHVIRGTLGNEVLSGHLDKVTAEITGGQSIAAPLRETGQFPPLLIQVIDMGERTGKLDSLLMRTADVYDRETAAALQRVMTLIPIVFILGLAVVVAFILAAVLLAVMSISAGVGV
ncbi:MAG: hypothetical protein CMJ49_01715 [Planctomycetaceae bacterium]|nr:hypothetical protein [Planctomycetaceae bacterium]